MTAAMVMHRGVCSGDSAARWAGNTGLERGRICDLEGRERRAKMDTKQGGEWRWALCEGLGRKIVLPKQNLKPWAILLGGSLVRCAGRLARNSAE